MGTDLFKQGIDRGEDSLASSVPVVEDPTGSLSLSRTVTPVATGPKVLPIPEPDPDLLALFAPQADGDFDADGLGDGGTKLAPGADGEASTDDWQALLDDSIPVPSLAKPSIPRPNAALTAELTAIGPKVIEPESRTKRPMSGWTGRAADKTSRLARFVASSGTTLAKLATPTPSKARTAGSSAATSRTVAPSDTAPSTTTANTKLAAGDTASAGTKALAEPRVARRDLTGSTASAAKSDVALALGETLGRKHSGRDETDASPITVLPDTAKANSESDSEPEAKAGVTPEVKAGVTAEVDAGVKAEVTAGANDVSDTNDASDSDRTGAASSSTGRILAATSDPTSGELPLETAVAPLRPARQGLDAFDSKRRLLVAGAIVAGIGLISAYLLTQESDDGGAETTADTEEAAAEDRRDDEEPATERTTTTNGASGERALDDEQASSIAREIAAAGRLQSSSTTERTTTQASTSVASSPASADGTTPGTGDSAADPNEPGDGSSTTTPSATTPDASSTTESPSSTATPSTTCTGVTWIPVLDEGFNGTTLDSGVWSTGQGSAGQGVQQANAISVANGSLNITAQMLDGTLVSGGVQHRGGQAYGRFEVRVRTDNDASGTMSGQIATAGSGSSHVLYNTGSVSNAASWHTMAVEWTPTSVKYFADGALVRTVEDNIPAAAQTLSLRYDASGSTLPSNVTMQVDHVKISEYGGGC